MKLVIVLVVVLVVGFVAFQYARTSVESFDPAEQGAEVRAKVETGQTWTEVLEKAGEPARWRPATSDFDFNYLDRFEADSRDEIAKGIEEGDYGLGFSFLYRFGNEVIFAVNFDERGTVMNIQDRESPKDLMKAFGG